MNALDIVRLRIYVVAPRRDATIPIHGTMLAARTASIAETESLIEIAMWAAIGRDVDMPLYRLLGVRVNASRPMRAARSSRPSRNIDDVRLIQGMGYPAVSTSETM